MDAFSYLSVLLSIILGLAITQVLQSVRALMLARSRVRLFAPPVIWAVLTLLMATQSWWASFGLADHTAWTFAEFAVVLLQLVLLYMFAGLVLPDLPPGEPVDLEAHYWREARPLFGLLLAILAVSLGKDLLIDGHLPATANVVFHAVFGALAVLGMVSRRAAVHHALALSALAMMALYIGVLFARLG